MEICTLGRIRLIVKQAIFYLALLVPYLLCWLYVRAYAINTPMSDDFTIVLALNLLRNGQIGIWQILDAQHNEHRAGLPYVLMIWLADLTHYNVLANMYLGLVFVGGALVLSIYFGRRKLKGENISVYALVPIAWLICSVRQTQNLLMSFQGAYESVFFLLLCFFLLDHVKNLSIRFWGAALCALLSSFSFGNGLLSLPIGFLLLASKFFLEGREVLLRRSGVLAVWAVVSLLVGSAYFWHFSTAVGQGKVTPEFLMRSPQIAPEFVLGFLGSPVARDEGSAITIGIVFLALTLMCVIAFIRKPKALHSETVLPGMLICYAVLSACMAAYGRAQMGLSASCVSRYATVANYGWIGLYLLILLSKDLGRHLRFILIAATLSCFSIGAITTAMFCQLDGLLYRDIELNTENVIRSYTLAGPESLGYWTGVSVKHVVPLIRFLQDNQLSLFAKTASSYKRATQLSTGPIPYWAAIDYANGRCDSNVNGILTIDVNQSKETDFTLKGWVADVQNHKLPKAVSMVIDTEMTIPAAYGLTRPDVAQALGQNYLLTSGFASNCRLNLLSKGQHNVRLKVLGCDRQLCFQTPILLHLNVI